MPGGNTFLMIYSPLLKFGITYNGYRAKNPSKNLSHLSESNIRYIVTGNTIPFGNLNSSRYNSINHQAFGERSNDLMYEIPHKTRLLTVAQNYIGRIVEITPKEFSTLPYAKWSGTQMEIIGGYGTVDEAWCAHTVSHFCELAGINIDGHKKAVSQFIDWGTRNRIYKPIKTNTITSKNYKQERSQRSKQVIKQAKSMREGDLIIWKSDTAKTTPNGLQFCNASHIGIFESYNPDGTISIIEGNANETRVGKYDKYPVTNAKEGKNGNQNIGESQEINPRDGVIRKVYTIDELVKSGYSGYIDMRSKVR